MEKVKVYYTPGRTYLQTPQLRLNPGEAKDISGVFVPQLHELVCNCDLDDYLNRHRYTTAYRVDAPGLNLPWCLTEEEAHQIADEAGVPLDSEQPRKIMAANLEKPHLKPIELPVTEWLGENERGLYCRLNLHPEIDGTGSGKLFFPDHSCAADLCRGLCVITEINDKGNYGFFKGHMKTFQAPSDEALDAYIQKNFLYNKVFRYMKGKIGTYISMVTQYHSGRFQDDAILVQGDDGQVQKLSMYTMFVDGDNNATVTKEISVADYLCEGYQDCKFDELMAKFTKLGVKPHMGGEKSYRYISDLLDDATDDGIVKPLEYQGVFYIDIIPVGLMCNLMNYTRDEMTELIDTVNKINQAANETIKSKIKHGKINIFI